MNCATHNDVAAVAFCRTCGKPLCNQCTRDVRGVIYCEACLAARMEGTAPGPGTVGFVPPTPGFVPPTPGFVPPNPSGYAPVAMPVAPTAPRSGSGPNPAVAGILAGFFPFGVGAVYCSQYAKGLAHLLIFALLSFGWNHGGSSWWIFFLGMGFFYVYQIIDSVRTAKAMQEGQPAPDPLGLGQSFSMGEKFDAGKAPSGAVILIVLGVLFLLHTMGFWEFGLDRFWPLIIVFLGLWMFYRRIGLRQSRPNACNCARCRSRWLMGPSMVLLTGVLLLLDTTGFADLSRTWPAWLLVVGVVKLVQSSASAEGHMGPLPSGYSRSGYPSSGYPPSAPPPPAGPSTSGPTQPTSSGEVKNV